MLTYDDKRKYVVQNLSYPSRVTRIARRIKPRHGTQDLPVAVVGKTQGTEFEFLYRHCDIKELTIFFFLECLCGIRNTFIV